MQYFFLSLLENFVDYISYNLYDEVFSVFDRLLNLCSDVLSEQVLKKCIIALVDKYTMKSKAHKASVALLLKNLFDVKISKKSNG